MQHAIRGMLKAMKEAKQHPFGECHAHMAMDAVDFAQAMARHANGPNEAHIRSCLQAYQQAGITFVRDGGDAYGVSALAKRIAPEYGIDYRTPLFAIHKQGTYGGIVGRSFADLNEYETLVKQACEEGADFIKIMTAGIMDFTEYGLIAYGEGMPEHEVRSMVEIAHAQGRAVMAHTNGARAVEAAARAGVDSVEHGNYLDDAAIAALAKHACCLVPTMAVAHNMTNTPRVADGGSRIRYQANVVGRICAKEQENVRAAWKAGVLLACGSDAGAIGVPHGQGALDEFSCIAHALGSEQAAAEALAAGLDYIKQTFHA